MFPRSHPARERGHLLQAGRGAAESPSTRVPGLLPGLGVQQGRRGANACSHKPPTAAMEAPGIGLEGKRDGKGSAGGGLPRALGRDEGPGPVSTRVPRPRSACAQSPRPL